MARIQTASIRASSHRSSEDTDRWSSNGVSRRISCPPATIRTYARMKTATRARVVVMARIVPPASSAPHRVNPDFHRLRWRADHGDLGRLRPNVVSDLSRDGTAIEEGPRCSTTRQLETDRRTIERVVEVAVLVRGVHAGRVDFDDGAGPGATDIEPCPIAAPAPLAVVDFPEHARVGHGCVAILTRSSAVDNARSPRAAAITSALLEDACFGA